MNDYMNKIEKNAFNIPVDPASVIGAITGAAIASNQVKNQQVASEKKLVGTGSYFKDAQNISNHLEVVITPFNVLYVINDGRRKITVDAIFVNEMTPEAKDRFLAMDRNFFKQLFVNKMMLDVALTEQVMAQRVFENMNTVRSEIGAQPFTSNPITKQGAEDMGSMFKIEKIAEILMASMKDMVVEVPVNLGEKHELLKHASFISGIKGLASPFFGEPGHTEITPGEAKAGLEIMMLPDRVLFHNNGLVMGQLPVTEMNEEGFEAFHRNDTKYFTRFFKTELLNHRDDMFDFEKTASALSDIKSVFSEPFVHPGIYHRLMSNNIPEFELLDPELIIKRLEEIFDINTRIEDTPLNKILSIHAMNAPDNQVFTSHHGFEKVLRALNDLPIDFGESEADMSYGQVIHGLKLIQRLTPEDDIYDNFSESVVDYLENLLAKGNVRLVYPENMEGELEEAMFGYLDRQCRDMIVSYLAGGDPFLFETISKEMDLVAQTARTILDEVRQIGTEDFSIVKDIINQNIKVVLSADAAMGYMAKLDTGAEITNAVLSNLAVDKYLETQDDTFHAQFKNLGLSDNKVVSEDE